MPGDDRAFAYMQSRNSDPVLSEAYARMDAIREQEKRGIGADMLQGFNRGLDEAGQSLARFMGIHDELTELGDWLSKKTGGAVGGKDSKWLGTGDLAETTTIPGALTEGFTQFLSLYIPLKGMGAAAGAGGFAAGMAAGGIADMLAFDPKDGNIASVARDLGMAEDNPFVQWMDSRDGSEAEGRIKNMIEGMLLSGAFESAVRLFKASAMARATAAGSVAAASQADSPADAGAQE